MSADKIQLRIGTTAAAVAANDTLTRDTAGGEIGITDDRSSGVGNVRGWIADGTTFNTLRGAEPRGIWVTPTDLDSAIAATIPLSALDTDGTLAANSDTRVASQKAVKTYVDGRIAAADAFVYKGVIDCSANPNYPAADAGHAYKVSVAGKIGGASGVNVEVGDLLLCLNDGTASGTQAGVGANWDVVQVNIDGAVVGPASSSSGNVATFSGATGKVIQDGGKALPSGAVVGTTDTQTITNKNLNSGTNTFPTLNQDTTGKAAKADALSTTGASVDVAGAGPPSAGQGLRATDATHATWQAPVAGIFGDGSDGAINFDGTTAALANAWSKSGSTYTLLRDIYGTDVHLSSSAILITAGFRLYCTGTLTVDSGCVVHNDGGGALLGGAGAAGLGGAGCTIGGGGAGGAAGTTSTGSAGTGVTFAMGGSGPAGGSGAGLAGGTQGAATAPTAANGSCRNLGNALTMQSQAQNKYQGGGGGGGGGGAASGTGTSGGGGGGGGVVAIFAFRIANSGTIRANGGPGAAAVLGTATGRGGGSGGGGGFVLVVSTSANNGTVQANGGALGAGAGTGTSGTAGAAGAVVWLQV